MKTTKRRARLGFAGWQAALKRFGASGLSVQAFCEREGLGTASFYQWRARLSRTQHDQPVERAARSEPTPAEFVDLGTLSTRSARLNLRLDLGSGLVLHLVRG